MLLVLSSSLFIESLLPDVQSTHSAVVNQTPLGWFWANESAVTVFRECSSFHYSKNPPHRPHCHNCSSTRWSRWKKWHRCHCLWLVSPTLSVSLHSKHTDTKVNSDHCTQNTKLLVLFETYSFSLSVCNSSFKLQGIGLFLFHFQH